MRNIYQEINQSKATRQKEKTTWKEVLGLVTMLAALTISF